jgi:hypothetical protein
MLSNEKATSSVGADKVALNNASLVICRNNCTISQYEAERKIIA